MTPPVALTVAGLDPAGGAGLSADLRTFAAHGVHGASVLTVATAQNTVDFGAVEPMRPDFVTAQIDALVADLRLAAVKTGMLWSGEVAEAVAARVRAHELPNLVVDPVLAGASGVRIVDPEVDRHYRHTFFPEAEVVTPNTVEAGLLLGTEPATVDEAVDAARLLATWGPRVVVVTGGRQPGDEAVDVVVARGRVERLAAPWIDSPNVRGSGDTFSAAVAADLALGHAPLEAVRAAHAFTGAALRRAVGWRLGAGQGPLDQVGVDPRRRDAGDAIRRWGP